MATSFIEYLYHEKQASALLDLVEGKDREFLHAVGSIDNDGYFVKLRADDGQLIWRRQYHLEKERITFTTGVECDNGDFILYGSKYVGANKNLNLVVRVDNDGQVIWARVLDTQRTRYGIRLVKSVDDTYFVTSWYNEKGSVDDVELIKLNGKGDLVAARLIGDSNDDQVFSMVAHKDGVVLIGGTSQGPGWDTFLIHLDGNLKQVWGSLIGDKGYQHGRDLVNLGSDRFAVMGEDTDRNRTFFLNYEPGASTLQAKTHELAKGISDEGFRRMIVVGKNVYVVGQTNGENWGYITKLDSNYDVVWHKRLTHQDGYFLRDVQVHPDDPETLRLVGMMHVKANHGLVISSDLEFETCLTESLPAPDSAMYTVDVKKWSPPVTEHKVTPLEVKLQVTNPDSAPLALCGGNPIKLEKNAYFQSPYVYLQAAGSTSVDDSVYGFHLRWSFLRSLGDKHLAKGDLSGTTGPFPSTLNFNRDNDFVRVYRAQFRNQYYTTVSLSLPPTTVLESGLVRKWTYANLIPVASLPGNLNSVEFRFTSIAEYDAIRTTINPASNPLGFIQNYNGVIEAKVVGKLCFKVRMGLMHIAPGQSGIGTMKLETVTLPDSLDPTSVQLSCRQSLQQLSPNNMPETVCENIDRIRFSYGGHIAPIRIQFLAYADYLQGIQQDHPGDWSLLGKYALSLDDAQVFNNLEDLSRFTIDGIWRKFNEPTVDEFRVSVSNYQQRWTMAEGLKDGVTQYLTLSQTDPSATATIPNNDPQPNDSQMEVSFLDMLNIVGLDFHAARMLGLGTIDPHSKVQGDPVEYLFLMEYFTTASLEGEVPAVVQHLYMTPPLTVADHKLPPPPSLQPVSYGMSSNNLTGNPTPFTDPNGYVPFADIRIVNLSKDQFRYQLPFESFFQTNDLFCLCDETIPMSFGLEYAPGNVGVGPWVRPELVNDANFQDPGGLNEVIPLAETETNPFFVHQETETGVHHYALYSINWFSRVSPISGEVQTDYTTFPLRCPLLPPLNLQAVLIQKEAPLIFTTGLEQSELSGITTTDKTYLRATWDWNYVHNEAYQFADKVQFYFRKDPPMVVKGEIATGPGSVVVDSVNHKVTVHTTGYTITSTMPAQVVTPVIGAGDVSKFLGASLVADGVAFVVDAVIGTGPNPTLVLKQIRETHNQESPVNSGIWYATETWVAPAEGQKFFLYENLTAASTWDQVLTKEVTVVNFSPTYTETVTHPDGQVKVRQIGGLTDFATIAHRYDTSPGAPAFTPTGVYDVEYATLNLTSHPDTDVEFHGGILRVAGASGDMKELQVWAIDNAGPNLKLVVYDPGFASDPIIPVTPLSQSGISVNFHPSYRAYFKVDGNFNEANTLPGFGEGTRLTFLTARSKDTTCGCGSHLAPPAVILAREIREPEPPGMPSGPLFATRPNFYGKATYTFDVEVNQPYSLIFYRANERRILDTLYKAETVQLILDELAALPPADAAFFQDRWNDLVNMRLDVTGNFKEYVPGGWRFKQPDNLKYLLPHPMASVQEHPFASGLTLNDTFTYFDPIPNANVTLNMVDVVKDAIDGSFLPLTESPLIYSQIHDDVFATSGRAPLIRDPNGQLLVYPNIDPWPMAFRFEKDGAGNIYQDGDGGYGSHPKFVRFTDYTLDGEAQNFYFYFAAELSNTLAVSDRSDVAGPIQLVNSGPAKAPKIKKVETVLLDAGESHGPAVYFTLNEIVRTENIQRFEIYRCHDAAQALSARAMTLAKTVLVGEELRDDFEDLSEPPYGMPLYYRIVALREILNEQGQVEYVPSLPSNVAMTNIVDNLNPAAPKLNITWDAPIGSPIQLPNVQLNWNRTAFNGTYLVYKLNALGNWVKIHSVPVSVHLNAPTVAIPLSVTDVGTSFLYKQDADLNTLYHRFRVDVENSSGLINKEKNDVTV